MSSDVQPPAGNRAGVLQQAEQTGLLAQWNIFQPKKERTVIKHDSLKEPPEN